MKKLITITIALLISLITIGQTNIVTKNNLIIPHGDITLYLDDDTSTMVSKHILTYNNYLKIGTIARGNDPWFEDTYKGKMKQKFYKKTGYDLGHLTPFKITSYNLETSNNSFSMFNQCPQNADFNEHPWEQLEMHVMDTIGVHKKDVTIITGVIYNNARKTFLKDSRIKIPTHYFKILTIDKITYCWIGDNVTKIITLTDLKSLNSMFKKSKMNLVIN